MHGQLPAGRCGAAPVNLNAYGFAYLTNYSASNYAVQASIQFGANGYGGGLGARLEPVGARITQPGFIRRIRKAAQNGCGW